MSVFQMRVWYFPFSPHISVALQETLGQDLKEPKCFTVNRSPETRVLGLRACANSAELPNSAGLKSVIKLSLACTGAKSGLSREQGGFHLQGLLAINSIWQLFIPVWLPCVRLGLELVSL